MPGRLGGLAASWNRFSGIRGLSAGDDIPGGCWHATLMDDESIVDLFAGLGRVSIRRMFGGKGIYHEGLIIAVELDGELLLKADATSAADFEAAGSQQWTYVGKRHGKRVAMPYWSVPDAALDDPDEMKVWAGKAFEAALRAGK